MKWLHNLLLVLGVALFAWLVAHVGLETVWREASILGWGIAVIVLIEGFGDLLHTWGWQRCFGHAHRPDLLRLWGPHLAGAAVNFVTPTATLGGEVVRGTLAPRGIPAEEVTASLTINKLTTTLADALMAAAGVVLLLVYAPLSLEWRLGVLAGAALFLPAVAVFLVLQRRGRLASVLGRSSLLGRVLGAQRAARVAHVAEDIDRRIAAFHTDRPGAAAASTALHVAGKAIGAVQLWLFLSWMGAPSDASTVVSVFLVARAIEMAAFFVPASLGTQEGAFMIALSLAGIPVSLGLTFSLVVRLEQLFWTGVGFAAYGGVLWQRRVAEASPS